MKQNRDERWETSGSDAATRGAPYDLLSGTRCGSSRRSSRTIARYGNSHVSMARDIVAMDRGSPERNVRAIPFKASPVEDNFPLRNPRMPWQGKKEEGGNEALKCKRDECVGACTERAHLGSGFDTLLGTAKRSQRFDRVVRTCARRQTLERGYRRSVPEQWRASTCARMHAKYCSQQQNQGRVVVASWQLDRSPPVTRVEETLADSGREKGERLRNVAEKREKAKGWWRERG